MSLATDEPHATRLQIPVSVAAEIKPSEITTTTSSSVDGAVSTVVVPEAAAVPLCTVDAAPPIIVTIFGRELHSIVVVHRVIVSGVSANCQRVVGRLVADNERVILSPMPLLGQPTL